MDARPSVLIVDDEKAICDLIYEELGGEGYTCDVAYNANDALVKINENNFNLALLDIRLPKVSGIALLKAIKQRSSGTIIIMMTAVNDLDTAIEAMRLGASDYIVKPFTMNRIKKSITMLLNERIQTGADQCVPPSSNYADFVESSEDLIIKKIDDIARGVDAQVNYFDFHSKVVTSKTIDIAKRLGFPAELVSKWEAARRQLELDKGRKLNTVLNKLERNPVSQRILDITQ